MNLLFNPGEDDKYEFSFAQEEKVNNTAVEDIPIKETYTNPMTGKTVHWFPVSEIFKTDNMTLMNYVFERMQLEPTAFTPVVGQFATSVMNSLQKALKDEKNISYFPTEGKSQSEVVEMFVRVNSGGQKLAASDLMLAVASGIKKNEDFHERIRLSGCELQAEEGQVQWIHCADYSA